MFLRKVAITKREFKQGSTIQFLNKVGGGMSTGFEKLIENEQVVFVHQKELKNGVETETVWQGAKEIYYLKRESDFGTELQVAMDITSDVEDYFDRTFPKALALVKQI